MVHFPRAGNNFQDNKYTGNERNQRRKDVVEDEDEGAHRTPNLHVGREAARNAQWEQVVCSHLRDLPAYARHDNASNSD